MTVKYFATIRVYAGEAARRLERSPEMLRDLLETDEISIFPMVTGG